MEVRLYKSRRYTSLWLVWDEVNTCLSIQLNFLYIKKQTCRRSEKVYGNRIMVNEDFQWFEDFYKENHGVKISWVFGFLNTITNLRHLKNSIQQHKASCFLNWTKTEAKQSFNLSTNWKGSYCWCNFSMFVFLKPNPCKTSSMHLENIYFF